MFKNYDTGEVIIQNYEYGAFDDGYFSSDKDHFYKYFINNFTAESGQADQGVTYKAAEVFLLND